ncbi:MAG: hypothetical protein ACRC9L_07090 [Brevinema sp.]
MLIFSFLFLLFPIAIFGQPLSVIQTAIINEDFSEIDLFTSTNTNWVFIKKPTISSDGELLLDFAIANNKTNIYQYLLKKGAYPSITTLFTAVKSSNYLIAQDLIENNKLYKYSPRKNSQTIRFSFSNEIETNIQALLVTNNHTNISQQVSTNAIGKIILNEYTNISHTEKTNFNTNIKHRTITNRVESSSIVLSQKNNSPVIFHISTNLTTVIITNFTNSYSPYLITNALGVVLERTITNIFPVIIQEEQTNIIKHPIAPTDFSTIEYDLSSISITRIQLIDLARMAENQGNTEFSRYLLEKVQRSR